MAPQLFRDVLVLTGPTGSGKSALGIELAERLGAEVVSMDSMALYRGMDIGTAKPTAEERRRVPHHLIDVLDPWESASVAWWLERAGVCVRDIEGRGKRALFVGGTPLYLKALLHGLFDGPPGDPDLRRRLTAEAEHLGVAQLYARLATVDPATAARLHPNDVRRVVRALEVWELTGRPISQWQTQWSTEYRVPSTESASPATPRPDPDPGYGSGADSLAGGSETTPYSVLRTPYCLWLDLPREELYARINARVDAMLAAGLVEEVRALRQLPKPLSREARQALGYQEIFDYLDGRGTLKEVRERIQTRSRQFAKRQLTWFRHLPECRPVSRELTFAAWGLTIER